LILHAGALALLTGSTAALVLLAVASVHAVKILRGWDFGSSSEEQLLLERRTHLISTIVGYALGFEALSTFLFVYTVDDVHRMLSGAMCATGSLNANPVGWYALGLKIVLLFAAAGWITLNYVDQRAEDLPLVTVKYGALLLLAPAVAADVVLQFRYFVGLRPDVITSCCGSLFTGEATGVASTLASLPPRPMICAFYASFGALFALGFACLKRRTPALCALFSAASLAVFAVTMASVVSFISIYIYELPTHHCPFDFLQAGYGYVGYPIYASLFVGTFFGLLPGPFGRFRRFLSLAGEIDRLQGKWVRISLACQAVFLMIVSYYLMFGNYRMTGP
jgi:hypothetical protein